MFRKSVSLTSFISFLVLLITSVILYFEPHGRVAYWGDWHFLGLTKTNWDDMHIVVGALFLVAILLHIWLNWKPIMLYMKNKARAMVVFTPAMLIALGLTFYFSVGAVTGLPLAQQVLDFSASLKDAQTERYGTPPYGHAELSPLKKFCSILSFDLDAAMTALADANIKGITPEVSLAELAQINGASPQDIYKIIHSALVTDPFAALPATTPEGTGQMTLMELSRSFGLDQQQVLAKLAAAGLKAQPDMTFKQIATAASMTPGEVYGLLRAKQEE